MFAVIVIVPAGSVAAAVIVAMSVTFGVRMAMVMAVPMLMPMMLAIDLLRERVVFSERLVMPMLMATAISAGFRLERQ
jgi:hypothetical protein